MPDVEILIVDGRGDTPPDKNEPVRRLQVPRQPLPFLWARGIAEAKGEWLVIMETTCPPAPGWLPALPRRTACAPGVFGGAVEMAEGHGVVDWAAYFCEYAPFMRPLSTSGKTFELPGNNICFHRDFLKFGRHYLAPGFWKTYWCGELTRNGIQLHAEPEMIVRFDKRYRPAHFFRRRFHHGRCYAGMRNLQLPGWKRILYAAGSLLLPLVMWGRMLRKFLPKGRLWGRYLAALPCSFLAVLAWAAGEMTGYGLGPGDSCEKIY